MKIPPCRQFFHQQSPILLWPNAVRPQRPFPSYPPGSSSTPQFTAAAASRFLPSSSTSCIAAAAYRHHAALPWAVDGVLYCDNEVSDTRHEKWKERNGTLSRRRSGRAPQQQSGNCCPVFQRKDTKSSGVEGGSKSMSSNNFCCWWEYSIPIKSSSFL